MKYSVDEIENELFGGAEAVADLPEMKLWRAVFLIGLEDWRAGSLQAARWIDSDEEGIGGWVWVCGQLGYEPLELRERLKRLKNGVQFAGIAVTRLCREW